MGYEQEAAEICPCDCNGDESIPHKPGHDKPADYICPSHYQQPIVWALEAADAAGYARRVAEEQGGFVPWTKDSPGGGCYEEVVIREMGTGYYADAECAVECEGIQGHNGPCFSRWIDGYLVTFQRTTENGGA